MPGSWEQQNKVLVGVLHVDVVTIHWAMSFRDLIIPGGVMPMAGTPYDHGRNLICMKALEIGATHVFMLDSDVMLPYDTILRLIKHNQPIISGIYCRRSPPAGVPVMQRQGQWVTQYPKNSIIEVDVVGSGCLLIRRDVLEKMKPSSPGHHWFDWRVDMRGSGVFPDDECMSEDFVFCNNARKQGWKVLVDTSIMCKHVGYAEATFAAFNPIGSTQVA